MLFNKKNFYLLYLLLVSCVSCVWLFVTLWAVACQASLSFTISWNLLKFVSIQLVTLSNHHILWQLLLFLPSIFPSIRDFSSQSAVHIRWPNTGVSVSTSVLLSSIQGWSPLRSTGLLSLLSKGHSGAFSSTTVKRHQFFGALPSLWYSSHNHTWPLGRP